MTGGWLKDILGNEAFESLKDDLLKELPANEPSRTQTGLIKSTEAMSSRLRDIRRRRPGAKRRNDCAYWRDLAIEKGNLAPGVEYWILPNGMSSEFAMIRKKIKDGELPGDFLEKLPGLLEMDGALNGYVAFNKRHSPVTVRRREATDGILAYVPVHGGITSVNKDQTASVFGFDTCHYYSKHFPITDKSWIQWQCKVLHEGLVIAGKIEKDYLRARGNNKRCAEILQPLRDLMPEEELGFGAMINLLSGEL